MLVENPNFEDKPQLDTFGLNLLPQQLEYLQRLSPEEQQAYLRSLRTSIGDAAAGIEDPLFDAMEGGKPIVPP